MPLTHINYVYIDTIKSDGALYYCTCIMPGELNKHIGQWDIECQWLSLLLLTEVQY